MPILLGRATKLSRLVTRAGKEYVGVLYLHGDVSDQELEEVISQFRGPIYQRPPVKAAVARELRVRRVCEFEILEREDRFVLVRTVVEAGTYIRRLFYDVGEVLGVGASMRELRRIRSGPLHERDSVTMQDIEKAVASWAEGDEGPLRRVVTPVEEVLSHVPRIVVKDSAVSAIAHGDAVKAPGVVAVSEGLRKNREALAVTLKGEVIAVVRPTMDAKEVLDADRGIVAEPERVVMERDLYPPMWKKGKSL